MSIRSARKTPVPATQAIRRARDFARRADTRASRPAPKPETVLSRRPHAPGLAACGPGGRAPARTISDLFLADILGVARGANRNGATYFQYWSGDRSTYRYWMTHSVFGVAEEPGRPMARFGFAGGDLTGSRLPASATWIGRMVGPAVEGAAAGTRVISEFARTREHRVEKDGCSTCDETANGTAIRRARK